MFRVMIAIVTCAGIALSGACGAAQQQQAKKTNTRAEQARFVIVDMPPPMFVPDQDDDDPAFQAAMDAAIKDLIGQTRDLEPYEAAELAAMDAISNAVPEWCTTLSSSVLRLPSLGDAPGVVAPFPWPAALLNGAGVSMAEAIQSIATTLPWLERVVMGSSTAGDIRLPAKVVVEFYFMLADWALSEARQTGNRAAQACLIGAGAGFTILQRAGEAVLASGRLLIPDETELREVLHRAAELGLW